MSYNKQTWADGQLGATPITANKLNYIENGIANADFLTCTSTTRPTTGLFDGMRIYETDTKAFGFYDAASAGWHMWDTVAQTYTPVFATAGGTPAVGNGSLFGRYFRRGRQIDFSINFVFGSTTNGGTGPMTFTAPFTALNLVGYEPEILLKAWTLGGNYVGFAYVPSNSTTINLFAPVSSSNCLMGQVQNANSAGTLGTGVPAVSGSLTFSTGSNININGTYEANVG
jgi:hypothetical protein